MTDMTAGRGGTILGEPIRNAAVDRAHDTLRRGARFLGAGLSALPDECGGVTAGYRAKVLGNGLRELDRFLNILIEEVAHACGVPGPPNERNTANKLRRLRGALRIGDADHGRLTALGRSRDCLFHCSGRVGRGDRPGDSMITAGWPGNTPHRVAVGGELILAAGELAEICDFYVVIADSLVPLASLPHRAA